MRHADQMESIVDNLTVKAWGERDFRHAKYVCRSIAYEYKKSRPVVFPDRQVLPASCTFESELR